MKLIAAISTRVISFRRKTEHKKITLLRLHTKPEQGSFI